MAGADPTTASVYQGRQDAASTTFDPGELEWNKTYYWRVDEVNEADAGSPWKGSLWSFTTADFLVIDDFEIYTDDEGSRIYQTWLDGWAANGVRLDRRLPRCPIRRADDRPRRQAVDAPGLQQRVRRTTPEIEREFTAARTGLSTGVNTLVLHVRGKAGNRDRRPFVAVRTARASSALFRDSPTSRS